MKKKDLCILLAILATACGTKENKSTNKQPFEKKPVPSEDMDNYFSLLGECDLSFGNAVIDGKCVPLRVNLSIEGKISIDTVESHKNLFEGGVGIAPRIRFPFESQDQDGRECCEINMKKSEAKSTENSIRVHTKLRTDVKLSSWVMVDASAGEMSRAQVELNILGRRITSEEQTKDKLKEICTEIQTLFKKEHPLANNSTDYWFNELPTGAQCLAGNSSELPKYELEDFKRINLWWHCEREECYFESLSLN